MLPCFKSKLLEQIPYVTHGFFTRNGGVSCGHYATLNVAERKTDDPEHVTENRYRIQNALECDNLQFNHQIHSAIVHHINTPGSAQEGDALITQTPRLLVGVQTADCLPILMAHKKEKIVAAVHAGWKGSLAGIIQSTLEELKQMCDLTELCCVIGPSIAVKYFEVGEDVHNLGIQFNKSEFFQKNTTSNNKWNLDLRALVQQIIQDFSITDIDHIHEDTYSQPNKFFSYRRSTHANEKKFGGQASVIGIL